MTNIKYKPSPPCNSKQSFSPSPRRCRHQTILRLARPTTRLENNKNDAIDEYGERKTYATNVEQYYSDLLDKLSHEVCVPNFMRPKIIQAIIEAEKPAKYNAMRCCHKNYMTCSKAKQERMQRNKAKMRISSAQEKKASLYSNACMGVKRMDQEFTRKLFKVMLVLQHNEMMHSQLNLKEEENEKSSLRSLHIKVVASSYITEVFQKATRSLIRRERRIYYENLLYEEKVIASQIKIARAWKRVQAFRSVRSQIAELIVLKKLQRDKEAEEEKLFLNRMEDRMIKENKDYAAWQAANKHVPLCKARDSVMGDVSDTTAVWSPFAIPKSMEKVTQGFTSQILSPRSHIDDLMRKYGKNSSEDGFYRKKRFFDVIL